MAAQLLTEHPVLLGKGLMSIPSTPFTNPFEPPRKPLAGRFALDNPLPPTGPAPVMGKAQEIEGARLTRLLRVRSPERHQTRLLRVDRQPVSAKAFGQHLQHALRILLVLKPHDHIIGKADHEGPPAQSWFHLLGEPEIKHIMKIHVTE